MEWIPITKNYIIMKGSTERESIALSIPERNRGDVRSKEVALVENRWVETGNWEFNMCCRRTSSLDKHSKNGVGHQDLSLLCRFCKEKVESVTHVVSSCSVLTGNQYRKRHNTDSCTRKKRILKLNVKTNGSCFNQNQCWRMRNIWGLCNLDNMTSTITQQNKQK